MSGTILSGIHKAFMGFDKRAERASDDILEATFVDSGPLFDLISTTNNQIMYGRRGTGKTHVLKYLQGRIREPSGEVPIYIDLRNIGSNGSIYGDDSKPLSERANRLIVDVLSTVSVELLQLAVNALDSAPDPNQITLRVDDLDAAISSVQIAGEVEFTEEDSAKVASGKSVGVKVADSPSLEGGYNSQAESTGSRRSVRTGKERIHLNFGSIATALAGLISVLGVKRLWLLIDEWSEIPVDLQPYLADLLRRTVLPIREITLKIAAIDHRSNFALLKGRGEYIGLELGADITADLNLDDFLVFENSQEKATEFFKTLLFKHYQASEHSAVEVDSSDRLIQNAFTQLPAFDEFAKAVEGVPRDALNLATKVATKAFGQQISAAHVRGAARDWYQQDKHAVIRNNVSLDSLLNNIIGEVIANRRARAFLFPSNARHELIDQLFDARILHVRKRNVSSNDEPGARYDVYKIDYGCYVDLINTNKAPTSLFDVEEGDTVEHVEVPRDDYRSIRRAILRPEMIEKWTAGIGKRAIS